MTQALKLDPETGFLEASKLAHGIQASLYTAEKKLRFFELAHEAIDKADPKNPNFPTTHELCKMAGVNRSTHEHHLKRDPHYKEMWEQVRDRIEDLLETTMLRQGLTQKGYMDRITWLRANRPGKWNPDRKIIHVSDQQKVDQLANFIDAEIVPATVNTEARE